MLSFKKFQTSTSCSLTMATSVDIKTLQYRNIANALEQNSLSDVTFIIGSAQTEFRSNRLLFAAISDVFKASDSVIPIDDIDARGFRVVMDFAHCKEPRITTNNVVTTKNICRKYQICSLSPVCDQHFKSKINQQSFFLLLNDSINYKMDEYVTQLKSAVNTELGQYAEDMVKSVGFKCMGLRAMTIFLQFDELDITEERLWDAVLRWNECQNGKRKDRTPSSSVRPSRKKRKLNDGSTELAQGDGGLLQVICPYIRFGLMSGTYFVDKVQPQKCLSKDDMLEIANYILCDDKSNRKCGAFSVQKRMFTTAEITGSMLPFKLKMLTTYAGTVGLHNIAETLWTNDLKTGCATLRAHFNWIEADFERPVIILRMDIAPFGLC